VYNNSFLIVFLFKMGLSAIVKELQAMIAMKIFDWVSKKPAMTKNKIQLWLQKAFHSHSMDDGREIMSYAELLVTGSPFFENLYKERISIVTHQDAESRDAAIQLELNPLWLKNMMEEANHYTIGKVDATVTVRVLWQSMLKIKTLILGCNLFLMKSDAICNMKVAMSKVKRILD